MELWDIKGNALRLMFADSDMQFDKYEFENGILYENGNTRDKLIRMNDSIRRAIDLYYQYCGSYSRKRKVKYQIDESGLKCFLDLKEITDFGTPSKIDLLENKPDGIPGLENIEYFYDALDNSIEVGFYDVPISILKNMTFMLYYKVKEENLPDNKSINDLTYDLDILGIPSEIQRLIPKYIKGEIYEEDEYGVAQNSKQEYIQALITYNKKFSNVQTRVHSHFMRG